MILHNKKKKKRVSEKKICGNPFFGGTKLVRLEQKEGKIKEK